MGMADGFQEVIDSLPDDWTDLELDLRIFDEARYIEAATFLVTCNAQPYSHHDWHWRILCAHRFGHAAAAQACLQAQGLQSWVVGEVVKGSGEATCEVIR